VCIQPDRAGWRRGQRRGLRAGVPPPSRPRPDADRVLRWRSLSRPLPTRGQGLAIREPRGRLRPRPGPAGRTPWCRAQAVPEVDLSHELLAGEGFERRRARNYARQDRRRKI
jgi:hypothetical protein